MPGINKKAGKVIRLKTPNTSRKPSARPEVMNSVRGTAFWLRPGFSSVGEDGVGVDPAILCINTKHHSTTSVSTEFEKVCVWKVHVTYEDATNVTASLRFRGECTSSWIAQSSSTKHKVNMTIRVV